MQNFLIRKDFLPNSYIKQNSEIQKDKDKKAYIGLIIISVVLLPINLNKLTIYFETQEVKSEPVIIKDKDYINGDCLLEWAELCELLDASATISNGAGIIKIDNISKVNDIPDKYSIGNITQLSGDYIVQIKKGDESER